ncbi:macro domain-containing protein [Cystobacter fuscus]|uniref:macro domain-containing protein n=1 Tax=Cystobacter fuscus TaxID=43 RepID=UPI0009715372|nr:macro domain-containing protein [Cystobacter fuscus]
METETHEHHKATEPRGRAVILKSGDLFTSNAQALVITVNCVGVMGKGIALEAKKRYPDMYEEYARLCKAGEMRLGRPMYVRRLVPPSFVLFPTKGHWRSVSNLADIRAGLDYLTRHVGVWGIESLAAPPLGCGAGGLEWAVIGPILYDNFEKLGVPVDLYVPSGVSADDLQAAILRKGVEQADLHRAAQTSAPEAVAIVVALKSILQKNPQVRIGRILLQKMAYFAQIAGIPVPVKYVRATYGPYSDEWTRLIRHMVNNGLLSERQVGSQGAFAYAPGPALVAYAERLSPTLEKYQAVIEKLALVFSKFTNDQAELAATTLMVAREKTSEDEIIADVLEWKRRRSKPYSADQVRKCLSWLRTEGWLRH